MAEQQKSQQLAPPPSAEPKKFTLEGLESPLLEVEGDRKEMLQKASGRSKLDGVQEWCKCGNCCVQSLDKECLCCHEVSQMKGLVGDEGGCVTSHDSFRSLVIRQELLEVFYFTGSFGDSSDSDDVNGFSTAILRHDTPSPTNADFRCQAYKFFRQWVGSKSAIKLSHVAVHVPACVIAAIRAAFPSQDGKYPADKFAPLPS